MWRDGVDLGLEFGSAIDLPSAHSGDARIVRRIWLERRAR
jgi:hypothetical protein